MKMISIVISCLLLTGCNIDDNVKSFIPGIYVAEWKTEFNESRDTMLIHPLTQGGSETYRITRRTWFRYRNEKRRGPEYKLLQWTGSYDEKQKTIMVHNTGRVLSFDPANAEMKMGTITYKKL